jgi:chromosome segregation ATPase
METLEQLNITYKLVDGGKDAWENVPILLATSKQRITKPGNSSVTNTQNEILELKKQIQLLTRDKSTFESQAKQLQQETTKLELQIKENDKELISLINDRQSLKHSLDECEQQIKIKDNKINMLESEKYAYNSTSIYQNQTLDSLRQDKKMMEQDKINTTNEMEQLKAAYATLEQLLKSKEDVIASLNRENQGNQQGTNVMVETLNNLLQGKTSEMELQKQNMELLLANEKRRIDALEQENKTLKQERLQQQTAAQNTGSLSNSSNPTNNDSSHHDQQDDSYNDINYETEYSDTDESDGDDINYDTPSEDNDSDNDINYDTPSEDEDTNNDLNYDDPK